VLRASSPGTSVMSISEEPMKQAIGRVGSGSGRTALHYTMVWEAPGSQAQYPRQLRSVSSGGRGLLIRALPAPAPGASSRLESFSATRTCALPQIKNCSSVRLRAMLLAPAARARPPVVFSPAGRGSPQGRDILTDTRLFEIVHVGVAVGYGNDPSTGIRPTPSSCSSGNARRGRCHSY
jgi:hypothetical protein